MFFSYLSVSSLGLKDLEHRTILKIMLTTQVGQIIFLGLKKKPKSKLGVSKGTDITILYNLWYTEIYYCYINQYRPYFCASAKKKRIGQKKKEKRSGKTMFFIFGKKPLVCQVFLLIYNLTLLNLSCA